MGKLRLGEIKEQILGHMKSTFWGQEIWLQITLLIPSMVSVLGAWPPSSEFVQDKSWEGRMYGIYLSLYVYTYLRHLN